MATGYEIDFTDQNPFRTFDLREYTTNGPTNPQDGTLDAKATDAASTLLLYGKGSPNYGERIQENMLHLLEHFAGTVEPVYPVSGQIWFDRNYDPNQLRVYDAFRHELTNDPDNPTNSSWVAVSTDSVTESTELIDRYGPSASNPRVRVRNSSTGERVDHTIATPAVLRSPNVVAFQIAPAPASNYATGQWYIGGWEFILQNNAELHEDLNAGGWNIVGLAPPTQAGDAATYEWVNTQIFNAVQGNNQLGELTDVTITNPQNDQVLKYSGGQWINATLADIYLPIVGGTMLGNINMNNAYRVQYLLDPVLDQDAATKFYVDDALDNLAATFSLVLDDLLDVSFLPGTLLNGQVLERQGGIWKNTNFTDLITTYQIVQTSGTTFTGAVNVPVTQATDPGTTAVSKNYVDNEIASAVGAASDFYTYDAQFDSVTGELTIRTTNPSVGLGGDIIVDISSASGGNTTIMDHTVVDANNYSTFGGTVPGLASHRIFYNDQFYPNIDLDKLLHDYAKRVGVYNSPRQRVVFTANGGSTFYLGNTSTGTFPNRGHARADIGMAYVMGFGSLGVYVNGVRAVASEHAYLEIDLENVSTPPDNHNIYEGVDTELTPGTVYSFQVSVDGGANQLIVLRDDLTGGGIFGLPPFDNIQRWGYIVAQINAQADDGDLGFGAVLNDGLFYLYSTSVGSGSNISVTDGGGGHTAFFTNVGGSVYTASVPGSISNPYTPGDYGLIEEKPYSDSAVQLPGRVGMRSNVFRLDPAPASGAIVEVIIEHEMFGDPLPD